MSDRNILEMFKKSPVFMHNVMFSVEFLTELAKNQIKKFKLAQT